MTGLTWHTAGVCPNRRASYSVAACLAFVLALAVLLSGLAGGAQAQTTACSENSGLVSGVECIEPADSTRDIDIRQDKQTISTTSQNDPGIHGYKKGSTGDIDIDVRGSTISTTGGASHGVQGQHDGTGSVDIDVRGSTVTTLDGHGVYGSDSGGTATSPGDVAIYIYIRDSDITTGSAENHGVFGSVEEGAGNVRIDLRGTDVETVGAKAAGVKGLVGSAATGNLGIKVTGGSTVSTSGNGAPGIEGRHSGTGNIDIDVAGSTVTTTGGEGTQFSLPHGVYGHHDGTGDIAIDVTGGSTIEVSTGHGIFGRHEGSGAIRFRVRDSDVTGTGVLADNLLGIGVYGWHSGAGDIVIDIAGGTVTGAAGYANGVVGQHSDSGDINIRLRSTTVTAADGRGVSAYHEQADGFSNAGDIDIDIAGSTITAKYHGVYGYHNGGVGAGGDIDIDVAGSTVTTTGDGGYGVFGWHQGTGNIGLRVRGSKVTTSGDNGRGVFASHYHADGTNVGHIDIDVIGSTITTTGTTAYGVYGYHNGLEGNIDISVTGGSSVSTLSASVHGIYARHQGTAAADIAVTVADSTVTTSGDGARGIYARRHTAGSGDVGIFVRGGTVTTTGGGTAYGVHGWNYRTGDIGISVTGGSSVSTSSASVHAIYAQHQGSGAGDIAVAVQDSTVTTSGTGARGIYARRHSAGTGDIDILVRGSTVRTTDEGVYALHQGESDGAIRIHVRDSHISTSGDTARGVMAWQNRGTGDILITIQDSTITTSGDNGSHGVYAQALGGNIAVHIRNAVIRPTGADSHGVVLRGGGTQTVSVNSEVQGGSGDGAGIVLYGGGLVIIGPHGRVRGGPAYDVAVWAPRNDPSDTSESPRLHLVLMLGGRRLEKAVDGRVVNPDGTTALTVNGVEVFDDAENGARDVWVPNGAWDVRATGTDLATLAFTQVVAPRAAVYEALPGVLLRLDDGGGMGDAALLRSTHTPVWARIAVGQGSYEPGTATVGAGYDYDRYSVASGMDFRLPYEGLTGWAGVRVVSGSAKVSSPTGGGRIEARGMGLIGGVAWEGEDDWYGRGRLSLTRYNADLSSETRGGLKSGVTGLAHGLDLEGGRGFDLDLLGRKTRLTARGALRRSGVSMGEFDDGLFSRVSIEEANRLTAGAGVDIETGLLPRDGADRLTLRGSLDAARVLSGGTKVDVSGTALESKAGGTRLGAGLGAAYRMGGYTIGGSIGASGLGSDDTSYSVRFQLRFAF